MEDIPKETQRFRVRGHLWLESEKDRFLGPGRIELMEKIKEHGSISKAASAMGMSYKKAWNLVLSMNSQVEKPLVLTQTGGSRGGGAVVTPEGEHYIEAYKALVVRFQEFLANETRHLQG
ncbi:winged helix-turn-helix domain-containing protein [Telluribacter sp. SYSU D00476]|uniref:winged helix-turn-helix domain-containing protein n=1 Tax=Telluribacter sp. SYSU D00476 TaxID=2811430 RepID=UPI001FF4370F|nr:winged helix-turn-helix domain-containing protein [Telluribacter sp. SYSU D00476]